MPIPRRRALAFIACATTLTSAPAVQAQDKRPIEWIVGMAPGGGSDVVARTVAEEMSKSLGQSIIVVNKPGAATNIAADYVAKSRSVDNVLLTGDFATLAANPFLYERLSYSAEKDLASVGMMVRFPLILVVPNSHPARHFKEFVAWARAQPAGVVYASPGSGTPHHLAMESLLRAAGLKATHVPYRGAAPALNDVMAGQVPFMFAESASGLPLVSGGKLRALAVTTAQRMKTLPEVPTLQEQGLKGFEAFAWQGISVPAGANRSTVERLNTALRAALDSTMVKARFQALGVEGMPGTPEQMNRFAAAERVRWGALIKELGLKAD